MRVWLTRHSLTLPVQSLHVCNRYFKLRQKNERSVHPGISSRCHVSCINWRFRRGHIGDLVSGTAE